ncbi:MAG TPA: MFS transporter [Stellaceae bacterium]|nr:MFS transporter [Stellaceae bacterium]
MRNGDFWRLWFVGLVLFVVRWLELLAMAVFVYERTGSPFLVALLTMLRLVPMSLFGVFVGAAADRVQRHLALIAMVSAQLLTSFALLLLAYSDQLAVWHLAVASFVNGIGWTADNPVRRVMIGEVVGVDAMGTAMSVDVGTNNASRMLGPTAGGLLLAGFGMVGVLAVSVMLALTALSAALTISRRSIAHPAKPGTALAGIIEGLWFVRRNPHLIGVLIVTIVYNLFGWPFTSMIPVIGQDHLHLGEEGVGFLASTDGLGALCGAITLALFARSKHYARVYVGGVAAYLVALIGFALAPNVPLATGALVLTGIASAAFSIMQATIVYRSAPPELRSRMLGVLSVCIGVGPIGFLHLGWLADSIGAQRATAVIGLEGLLVLLLTRRFWREVSVR